MKEVFKKYTTGNKKGQRLIHYSLPDKILEQMEVFSVCLTPFIKGTD
jgi:hypothetical protein